MRKALYSMVVLLLLVMDSAISYANGTEVLSIRLQGIKYLYKNEILQHGVYVKDGKVFVDVNTLRTALQNTSMIESFAITVEKGVCTIHVKEKEIIAVVLIDKGNTLLSVEVDSNLRILSTSRVYAYDRPIIKISQAEIIDNKLSPRIIHILMMLKKMMQNNSALVSRISVINCMNPEVSYVQFRGFTLKCIWDETYNGLALLDAVIGLYDSKKAYHDNAVVTQKRMVVW